jgi:hypothetical protein
VTEFRWLLRDGGENRWSDFHALSGPCQSCCCAGPKECPKCGGREHSEPVEGMTADGWMVVDARLCQVCREDGCGDPAEIEER